MLRAQMVSRNAHCWWWGRLPPRGLYWCVLAFGEGTETQQVLGTGRAGMHMILLYFGPS